MHVPPAPASSGRRGTLAWLIVSQLLLGLSLLPWFFAFGFASLAFYGSFSSDAWLLVIPILIYPLLVLAGIIMSWVMFNRHRHRAAVLWTLGPLLLGLGLGIITTGLVVI